MIKNRDELFHEIKSIQDIGYNVYVGKKDELIGDVFDTRNLCVATLFNYSINLNSYETNWNETEFKYIFERVNDGDKVFYREIFSGAKMKLFDFSSLMRLKGIYLNEPVSYEEYVSCLDDVKSIKKVKVLS